LLTLDSPEYSTLRICITAIKAQIDRWHACGDHPFSHIAGLPRLSPVTLIRRILEKCHDDAPTPGTTELAFVTDADLRESIRRDISAASRDLTNGEWKGATVLAGSAVEALPLWALQEMESKTPGSLAAVTKTMTKGPSGPPDSWDLNGTTRFPPTQD
jgi:hypothetical protein